MEVRVGELTLKELDDEVLAGLSTRAATHGRSVNDEAAAILRAEIDRLNTVPSISEEKWLVMAEAARRQWKPLGVSMVDLIREGRDER